MPVTPDTSHDGRFGDADHIARVDPPAGPDARPDDRSAAIVPSVGADRRARRRTQVRQAVVGRRRGARTGSVGRSWIGLALLVLVGSVAWFEIGLNHEAAKRASRESARGNGAAADAPTAAPSPAPVPTVLPGPEVAIGLREANGPIDGCLFHPALADLRMRIGTNLVGECVEDARSTEPGTVRQRTTRGELFWEEDESKAAFTDGTHAWLTGPTGIVRRHVDERFAWERDAEAGPRPATTTHVLPPALPGAMLPERRIVSYYGNPLATGMGVLGEAPPETLFPRLRAQTAAYGRADRSRTAMPALELVTVVAQGQPGADGLYRLRMDTELIDKVLAWADEHGFLLILDVQNGRGKVDDEVRWLLPYLKRPNVHLALDPEFAMPPGQVPGQRIGTMDAATINGAQRILADLVESEGLPPKLLVVHRFTEEMVTNAQKISADPRVQVVMVMDGFGGPSLKARQYETLIAEQRVQYTGFKLFYRHDDPLMTPEQVLLLEPSPDLIIYQ